MGIGARNPRYEVVFFDLYGTLIDIRTDEQSEAAWQALYDCVTELGAQYESVDVMRDQFEKLEAREMVHQADRAIVRNGWDEFDILPVYRSLLMTRSEEAEKKLGFFGKEREKSPEGAPQGRPGLGEKHREEDQEGEHGR